MKSWLKILPLISVLSANAFAGGSYISGFYGVSTSSSASTIFNNIKGKTMGGALGFVMSDKMSFEFMGRQTTFNSSSSDLDFSSLGLGTVTFTTKIKAIVATGGLRFTLFKFFNVHGGAGYSSVDPGFTASATNAALNAALGSVSQKVSGLGYYYGGGIQIPFGKVALLADYTMNKISSDVTSKEITGGLRFNF